MSTSDPASGPESGAVTRPVARPVKRFLNADYQAFSTVGVVVFVSFARQLLDATVLPALVASPAQALYGVGVSMVFYTASFFLFAALLMGLLERPFERVANIANVSLVVGLLPPLIDAVVGRDQAGDYLYTFSPLFNAPGQSVGETTSVWIALLLAPVFIYWLTGSVGRTLAAALGAYVILQFVGSAIIMFFQAIDAGPPDSLLPIQWHQYDASAPRSMRPFHRTNQAYLAIAAGLYLWMRRSVVWVSIKRSNHALPFVLLTLLGCALSKVSLPEALLRAAGVYLLFLTLLVHNDYYDRVEDELAKRAGHTTQNDVALSTLLFAEFIVLAVGVDLVAYAMLLVVGLFAGYLYHHPAVRLKARFCLSYMVEGVWTLVAFACGTLAVKTVGDAPPLGLLNLLVFGGGCLMSIPKDWKDIDSDRAARIPTLYVVAAKRGIAERTTHLAVVVAITVGLALPPVALLSAGDSPLTAGVLALCACGPGAALHFHPDKRGAVELTVWLYVLYLSVALFFLTR